VGVYEPLSVRHADRGVLPSSYLAIRELLLDPECEVEVFHRGCYPGQRSDG
jgi:hypothetical protein